MNIKIVGGVFPAIIQDGKKSESGLIIQRLVSRMGTYTIKNIDKNYFDLPNITTEVLKPTLLVLVDGLSSNIGSLLEKLHYNHGNTVNYIGGGAGSITLVRKPCVFSNDGFYQNAAVIIVIDWYSDLGVKHGWRRIDGPLLTTKVHQNIIMELNWESPFDIYKELIYEDSGMVLTPENFFSIAKYYPFGISKENSEYIVRDPISTNEKGDLICVGEVKENMVLDLLKGEHHLLVEASKRAANEAIIKGRKYQSSLIIDCISRTLFMEERFSEELDVVHEIFKSKNIDFDVEGVLSLGEISSDGNGVLEFYNKTILVSLFYE